MPEVVMQYDLDESGKMVNLVRKEEVTRCKECWNVHVDTIFGGYWCNGRLVKPDGFCREGERRADESD